ncbi:MAG: tRNA threonylcarbamoyladenosine dehydratase [Moraxella sp.]|nr:tRNA threonylcarbamoyladenosine dehydratase [Moraxella sp.]
MTNRRFTGTRTLYQGDFDKFTQAHVYIIGVGGVGSWVAEGLARTGIGEITLIDMDVLVESNVNRQLPALTDTFGESKISAMQTRLVGINPAIKANCIDDFLTADNVATLLPSRDEIRQLAEQGKAVVVLDCVDDMNAKVAIAMHCRFNKIKLIVSGGAGGKIDPTLIKVADLKDVSQDPLLARLRSKLRERGINQAMKEKFAIKCVYSTEQPKMANACESGLHCGGYGSAVAVTSVVAMVMVAECLKLVGR